MDAFSVITLQTYHWNEITPVFVSSFLLLFTSDKKHRGDINSDWN